MYNSISKLVFIQVFHFISDNYSDHGSIQSRCMIPMPAATNIATTSGLSEDVIDQEAAAIENLSETKGYGLCTERLSGHCSHQSQSNIVNVHNCSEKSYINLQSSTNNVCLTKESEV